MPNRRAARPPTTNLPANAMPDHAKDVDLICHCFGYTRAALRADARANGRSTLMAQILAAKKTGGCNCAATNPKGR